MPQNCGHKGCPHCGVCPCCESDYMLCACEDPRGNGPDNPCSDESCNICSSPRRIIFTIGYINKTGDSIDSSGCEPYPDRKFLHELLDEYLDNCLNEGKDEDFYFSLMPCDQH